MRVELVIKEPLYQRARRLAKKRESCFLTMVNEALAEYLVHAETGAKTAVTEVELPVFDLGEPAVDIADREALFRLLTSG